MTDKRTKGITERVQYFYEGTYHEAGHAIMHAYLKVPFHSVTIEANEAEGYAGLTRVVPKGETSQKRTVNLNDEAVIMAAGRAATEVRDEFHPDDPLKHFGESDRVDRAQVRDIGKMQGIPDADLDLHWKLIFSEACNNLRIPYVWAAVEELALRLRATGGKYEILAKEVREILRDCKQRA